MIQSATIVLDEKGFEEYSIALALYRNADTVAYLSPIVIQGYGDSATRLHGYHLYSLNESTAVDLMQKELNRLHEECRSMSNKLTEAYSNHKKKRFKLF